MYFLSFFSLSLLHLKIYTYISLLFFPSILLICINFYRLQGNESPTKRSPKCLMQLKGHQSCISVLAFSPDGLMLASGKPFLSVYLANLYIIFEFFYILYFSKRIAIQIMVVISAIKVIVTHCSFVPQNDKVIN